MRRDAAPTPRVPPDRCRGRGSLPTRRAPPRPGRPSRRTECRPIEANAARRSTRRGQAPSRRAEVREGVAARAAARCPGDISSHSIHEGPTCAATSARKVAIVSAESAGCISAVAGRSRGVMSGVPIVLPESVRVKDRAPERRRVLLTFLTAANAARESTAGAARRRG